MRQKYPEVRLKLRTAVRWVWKFLSSLKLAIMLILVLGGLSLTGALVVQVPDDFAADSQKYAVWLENTARHQTGVWYPVLRLLGLFNVFHSIWFITAGLLLVANILVCSFNRWKSVWRLVSRRKPETGSSAYLQNPESRLFSGINLTERLVSFFRKRGYRTAFAVEGCNSYVYAVKNRFSPLGTYPVHLSLIFFIVGYVAGQYWGFENSSFTLAGGETGAVGHGTRLELKLESFQAEYYRDGRPRDFRSQVILMEDGREVKRALIRVNQPLKYRGVRFYQTYFGPTAELQIKVFDRRVFNVSAVLDQTHSRHPYLRPAGQLNLPEYQYRIYFMAPASNLVDPALQKNQMGIEVFQEGRSEALAVNVITLNEPLRVGDLEITYTGQGSFSGFTVNRDYGTGFIWAGAVLLLLGLAVVFFFPRYQLQAAWLDKPQSDQVLYLEWNKAGELSGEAARLSEYLRKGQDRAMAGDVQREE